MKSCFLIIIIIIISFSIQAEDFCVVTHPESTLTKMNAFQMKDFLLKRLPKNSFAYTLFTPPTQSTLFSDVLESVIRMDNKRWKEYWQRAKTKKIFYNFRFHSELFILRTVTKNINAVGIVRAKTIKGSIKSKLKIIYNSKEGKLQ